LLRNIAVYQLFNAKRRNLPKDLEPYYCRWSKAGAQTFSWKSVTYIDQLTHSIITVVDVKNLSYKSLKDTH